MFVYADDLVPVASTPKSLQCVIGNTKGYCNKWGLEINHNKSEIVVFRKGG